jgi:hypothetical protein
MATSAEPAPSGKFNFPVPSGPSAVECAAAEPDHVQQHVEEQNLWTMTTTMARENDADISAREQRLFNLQE